VDVARIPVLISNGEYVWEPFRLERFDTKVEGDSDAPAQRITIPDDRPCRPMSVAVYGEMEQSHVGGGLDNVDGSLAFQWTCFEGMI
jgi:hypothetical protein